MTPDPAPTLYDWATEVEQDWPAPAEERTAMAAARPRVRFCRRRTEV